MNRASRSQVIVLMVLALLLIALSEIGLANGSLVVFSPSWEQRNLKGCVKEETEETSMQVRHNGQVIERWQRKDRVVQYDKSGREKKEKWFMGSMPTEITYYYNGLGKIAKVTQCYENGGELYGLYLYKYDKNGLLEEVICRAKDNNKWAMRYRWSYIIDKDGKLSKETMYDAAGKVLDETEYHREADMIRVKSTDSLKNDCTYLQNKDGETIEYSCVYGDGMRRDNKSVYEYDTQGNCVKEISTTMEKSKVRPEREVTTVTTHDIRYCR